MPRPDPPHPCDSGHSVKHVLDIPTLATKRKLPASSKKRKAGRTAKLKLSKWYQGAARSIGIIK